MAQIFRITATPRERLQLAILLLHRDLKIKGRRDERALFRARLALGLIGISEALLSSEYNLGRNTYQHDTTTRHRFTVTAENAEWLITTIEPLELNPATCLFIEPLLQRLETQEDSHDADVTAVYDEPTETPKWQPRAIVAPPDDPPDEPPADPDEPNPPPPPPDEIPADARPPSWT